MSNSLLLILFGQTRSDNNSHKVMFSILKVSTLVVYSFHRFFIFLKTYKKFFS